MPKRKSLEKFIIESNIAHGNKYDYSNVVYTNNSAKIQIICPEHGPYFCIAKRHSHHRQGCPVCGIGAVNYKVHNLSTRKTREQFLIEAKAVHGDKYDYSLCVYTGGKVKMPIICKVHGIFNRHAEHHINSKNGCPKCYNERRIGRTGTSGYCETFFNSYPEKKNIPAIVYVAKMHHKNDIFIKIGITTKLSIKDRFYYKSKNGTIITPVIEHQDTLYDAFLKEKYLLAVLAPYRFFPNRKFGGYTECFKINHDTITLLEAYFNINIASRLENE